MMRITTMTMLVGAAAAAQPVVAQMPAPIAPAPSTSTTSAPTSTAPGAPSLATPARPASQIQTLFDDGSAAMKSGNWQQALDTYRQLERILLARPQPSKSLSIVQLRIGQSLLALYRYGEAESLLANALASLPANDPALDQDRYVSLAGLASIRERNFDYPGAIRTARSALEVAQTPVDKLYSYDRIVQLGIFVEPDIVLNDIEAAQALIARHPDANKEWPAKFRALRGRALLNLGRLVEARTELDRAIKELGGLTSRKINLLDSVARSDAAIAALLAKDKPTAQRYLAYAGASDQAQEGFRVGRSMDVPQCGGKNGPQPDDVAIVEFSIQPNGTIGYARPVYFSGAKEAAIAFAKTVYQWSWTPEELERVPPFYRALARVELRCTNAFGRPDALDPLTSAIDGWLAKIAAKDLALRANSLAANLVDIRTEIIRQESRSGRDSKDLIYPYLYLAGNSVASWEERKNAARRAYELGIAHKAPALALAFLTYNQASYLEDASSGTADSGFQKAIVSAISDPVIASDAVATAALRLRAFDSLNSKARATAGAALLEPIVEDSRLPENEPYKVGARTRLANLLYNKGLIEAARAQFDKSGLSEQQCALLDARPAFKSGRLNVSDYPEDAYQFGFGGWAMVEFDIDATGKTLNQRPIMAWPPFVLGEAVANGVKGFRYQQSFRPGGSPACTSMRYTQSFKFQM